ncbi:glycosyltransferase family 9 protein, partial [Micromonospora sp. CV4]|uniref:glycosyltransferase family 9 protein n=1 Tax=Micromonospora sp. CV4 TaxID=2478711 RepID=UPI000F211270
EEIDAAPTVAPDLPAAVDEILRRMRAVRPSGARTGRSGTILVVRSDSIGDVLVTGPGIRAVAAGAQRVVLLCGPRGRAAAELLPGVDELIEWPLPWIDRSPGPVDPADIRALTGRLAQVGAGEAVVFTSYHQSPLPLALLLRMAGVPRISAISDDYPGSLLDVRHRVPVGVPEPERAISLAAAAGFALAPGDEPALRLRDDLPEAPTTVLPTGDYVVVHPGSSVPARACPAHHCADIVAALVADGHRVVVTGGADEREVTARVSAAGGTDLGGAVDLAGLARILAGARCVVVGNTGPAHLAAAVGVPVVSLFAPTVPFGQWAPYRVPTVRLGDAGAACRDTRAAVCPLAGHPCLSNVDPAEVVAAVRVLAPGPPC